MSKRVYLAISTRLKGRWVVQAKDIEDATGKVVSYNKNLLAKLERDNPGKDIELDLKFKEITESVLEI